MTRPLVLFVRIPKTATTLLHCMVENTLGKDAAILFDCCDAASAAAAITRLRTSTTFLASAHMPFGAHEHLEGKCEYVTLLRDPVDRVVSLYHHVQMPHLKDHWLHLGGASLAQWLTYHRELGANTCNTAVRYLAGLPVDNGSGGCFRPVERRHLDIAKRNLRTAFPVLGVMERFEPFLRAFERRHGLPAHRMGHVNGRRGVAPYGKRPTDRQSLPQQLVAAIDRDNELDLALYRWARAELAV